MRGLGSSDWEHIDAGIAAATGAPFRATAREPLGGGSINDAFRVADCGRAWFVKLNRGDALAMFEAEAAGLAALAETGAVRVPAPVAAGVAGDRSYLVLEHLALRPLDPTSAARLGRGLAALHRATGPRHGWFRDNTIGGTPQPNREADDWAAFYRDRRLGFQLRLAAENGFGPELGERGERLLAAVPRLLADHAPPPSLLHGDLWTGNAAAGPGREPVIFDPAVYHGDRETDLAMTALFGRFPEAFYDAYREAWPLPDGHADRRPLYDLYHVLNHLNLFGRGYLGRAVALVDGLLGAVP